MAQIKYKSITVKGYRGRIFKLEVPSGVNHAVFVMHGNTGKTTIIELLRWCFTFKESEANGTFRHMWDNPAHLLDFLKEGVRQICSIIIEFRDDEDNIYKFERKTIGRYEKAKAKERSKGDVIESIKDSLEINRGGEVIVGDNVNQFLNKKFKLSDSAEFAFFDGEKARNMMIIATTDVKQLIRIVEKRSTHNQLSDYFKKLKYLRERLLEEAQASLTDRAEKTRQTKYKKRIEERNNFQTRIDETNLEIDALEVNIRHLQVEIALLHEGIVNLKSVEVRKKTQLEFDIKELKRNVNNSREIIFSKYNDLIKLQSYDFFNEVKGLLRERGGLPSPYREDLIKSCLEHKPPTCIVCGNDLNDEGIKRVTELGKQVASNDTQIFLMEEYDEPNQDLYDFSDARKNILKYLDDLENKMQEMEDITLRPEELEIFHNHEKKRAELSRLTQLLGVRGAELKVEENRLIKIEEDIGIIEESIASLSKKKPVLEKINETERILKTAEKKMRDRTIEVIGNVISKAVNNILGENFSAELTEEHGLMLGEDGYTGSEVGGYSGRLILTYLFAEAMSQVSPIIIDSPVGNVGAERKALAKHLKKNHSQVILLCLPTELSEFAEFFDTDIIEINNEV